jgi:hypothetical protein
MSGGLLRAALEKIVEIGGHETCGWDIFQRSVDQGKIIDEIAKCAADALAIPPAPAPSELAYCKRCGYMATPPVCTKCGTPIAPAPSRSAEEMARWIVEKFIEAEDGRVRIGHVRVDTIMPSMLAYALRSTLEDAIATALTAAQASARRDFIAQIDAVAQGQVEFCDPPCEPGECWGCDIARILYETPAALRARRDAGT